MQEAYFRYMAENPTAGLIQEEEEEAVDYDSDGNPIAPTTKKIIMPLPPVDHSEVMPPQHTFLLLLVLFVVTHQQDCFFTVS